MDFFLLALCTLSLLATVVLFFIKAGAAFRSGQGARLVHYALLAAIIALGAWLRFESSPHKFKVFYDEYQIYNASQMMKHSGDFSICVAGTFNKCEATDSMVHGVGFPFLGAAAQKIAGKDSPQVLFALNAGLGVLCIPVIFIMVMAAGVNARAALLACFTAAVLPLGIALSGNASTENADFLFLAIAFTFVLHYFRDRDIVSGAGVFCSLAFCILMEPRNAFTITFVTVLILVARPQGRREMFAACAGIFVLALIFFILPYEYAGVLKLPPAGFLASLKTNLVYYLHNPFVPAYITISLFIAPLFLAAYCGVSRGLVFFPLVSIAAISMKYQDISQGDFPRFMHAATIPLMLYAGIAADWILSAIKNVSIRNGIIALYITISLLSLSRMGGIVLQDYAEAQDDYLSATLKEQAADCSVFAADPSLGMIYTENRTYSITKLSDEEFISKHPECKVIVFDMACASTMNKECQQVITKHRPRQLKVANILNYYHLIIGYVPPAVSAGRQDDAKAAE